MTNHWLERCLIKEIERLSSGISLLGIDGEKRRIKGYSEALPPAPLSLDWNSEEAESLGDPDPDDARIPYFLVKTNEIIYGEEGGGKAKLYLLFCICDTSDKAEGYQTLWNLLNRITNRFRSNTVLDAFYCEKEMRAAIQDEDTCPYYFGGVEMTWNLPDLEEDEVM